MVFSTRRINMDLKEKVFARVAENLGADKSALTPETTFQQLGADSLDMVEFSIDVETEFGVSVEQEDITSIKTLGDAIDFIEKKMKK
jgi:acyl carrier protein